MTCAPASRATKFSARDVSYAAGWQHASQSEQNSRAPNRAALLTWSRYWDDEFAVLLGHEVFGAAGRASACILLLNLDDELFRRFEIQANFAGWPIHRRRRFFNVLWREINKLNRRNFPAGSPRLHHLVKLE